MKNKKAIEQVIKKSGITDFKWINAQDIMVANWVRIKCTFGCSDYGLAVCPPNTPSVAKCKAFFTEYSQAVLIRFNFMADRDNYPSGYSKQLTLKLLHIEKEIFWLNYPKTFMFNQTCCGICKECVSIRTDCKNLTQSRPSPEAFAVDIFSTAKNAGYEIKVIKQKRSEINRFALLMIE